MPSNSIVTNGLVFFYDMYSDKSYRGAPTINHIEQANPDRNMTQSDALTSNSDAVSGGRWTVNHQDSIRCYNRLGGYLGPKINSGVQNYKNTYHGIWTYEEDLGYPVVTMRDIGDGSWMYAGFGLDSAVNTPTKLGLGVGDNYVISWDQWTTNTSKSANCGLYGQNATNTGNGFHDGLSNSLGQASSFNTKTHTWQRLWCVYTISANRGLDASWSQYNYGHYGGRGVLKVANWQLETGSIPSKYVIPEGPAEYKAERSNTESLIDLTGTSTITPTNMVYDDLNSFSFDGTNSYMTISPIFNPYNKSYTLEAWIKRDSINRTDGILSDVQYNWLMFHVGSDNKLKWQHGYYNPGETRNSLSGNSTINTDWTHVVMSFENGVGAKLYVNGELDATGTNGNPFGLTGSRGVQFIGTIYNSVPGGTNGLEFDGKISAVRMYDKSLTISEVKRNFNSTRNRYGV